VPQDLQPGAGRESTKTKPPPAATLTEISDDEAEIIENEKAATDLQSVYEEMDAELRSHEKINASFHKSVRIQTPQEEAENEFEEDEDAPVDIELNLVKNMLESFKSQEGLPGPIGTIMNRMGVVIPRDESDRESTARSEPEKQ
jgi:hypothetical protein